MDKRRLQENVSLLTKQVNGKQPPWDDKHEKTYTKPLKNEHAWEKITDLDLKEILELKKIKEIEEQRFVTIFGIMLAMLNECIIENCLTSALTRY